MISCAEMGDTSTCKTCKTGLPAWWSIYEWLKRVKWSVLQTSRTNLWGSPWTKMNLTPYVCIHFYICAIQSGLKTCYNIQKVFLKPLNQPVWHILAFKLVFEVYLVLYVGNIHVLSWTSLVLIPMTTTNNRKCIAHFVHYADSGGQIGTLSYRVLYCVIKDFSDCTLAFIWRARVQTTSFSQHHLHNG